MVIYQNGSLCEGSDLRNTVALYYVLTLCVCKIGREGGTQMVCGQCGGQSWIFFGILTCSYILAVCHLNSLPGSGPAFCYRNRNTRGFPIPSSRYGTWTWGIDLTNEIYQPRVGSEARTTKGTYKRG